ncbi:MAG: FkbM family methyltransferase [Edaphobacter sp.]|uniref:FkbM family methyltransferase n=1 Tax=Edaphobacter sp. TaxID=1934404 RepID=UPI0023A65EDA|nr:FkbM family methyltransferase [Edaphobacter sp.]MDE1178565.1 FkbM family methyltransferase [Edaphobacter sp.]
MKQLVKDALFSAGFHAGRHTRLEDLCGLMRDLRPVDCGRELIRIGGDADGGYLVPNDLDGIEYCFSPGVSTIADFENQLADRGIHCFMADYSVEAPPLMRPEFTFDRKFLGIAEDEKFLTLEGWKQHYLPGYTGEMILQMDIEGCEYEVLLGLPDSLLDQFRTVIIEFHKLELLFEPYAFRMYRMCFDKLLRHFHVAHIHPNNWDKVTRYGSIEIPHMMEFTFHHRRRAQPLGPAINFPHSLDRDNVPDKPHVTLPRCWYMS